MEHWEELAPGGLRLLWDDALFPPGTDSFLLSALPRLRPGLRVCDLGCGSDAPYCGVPVRNLPRAAVPGGIYKSEVKGVTVFCFAE